MADDPLATLAALYAPPFLVRLNSLPRGAGWRLELSEDDGASWTSLEPGKPGHASPGQAIAAGVSSIADWRVSRADASNAEIALFFSQGKLERRKILIDDPDKPGSKLQVDGYAALDSTGSWNESTIPIEAINKAKSKSGSGSGSAQGQEPRRV